MLPWILSNWAWLVSLFIVALVIAACYSTLTFDCYARSRKDEDYFVIKIVGLYGLFKFKIVLPQFELGKQSLQVKKDSNASENTEDSQRGRWDWDADVAIEKYKQMHAALQLVHSMRGSFKRVLSRGVLTEWKWYSYVGTGDAMTTAMTCGLLWSVKGMIFGTLSGLLRVKESPIVKIEPIYQTSFFATEWSCLVQMKLWHALFSGTYLMYRIAIWKKRFIVRSNVPARTN
ncbi:DUF2953 domain-containing protein [Paenibacillus endoradicis]|uniref:DUF2953 domain-containing protein n=1 Tax=Paenibacillus endoradicis TaxID=2972487 RepID=UPI002158C937|nr:DUF2953 domain-containing protein [Paenibacillus endoradicis]MCR8660340.1 DUF2953 domain-containing protein [Paenibacillus endoradicis]